MNKFSQSANLKCNHRYNKKIYNTQLSISYMYTCIHICMYTCILTNTHIYNRLNIIISI